MKLLHLVALSLLSSASVAQTVTLRGKVEDPGAGPFLVACTDTQLSSATVDLNAFVGQQVVLQGTAIPGAVPPHVVVSTIAATAQTFEIPGNPTVGGTIRFAATYTPGSLVFFYAALGPGFRPVGAIGTSFLDPATLQRVTSGVIPAPGVLQVTVNVPNDPALIGRTAHGQAAIRSGVLFISNPDCKTLQ